MTSEAALSATSRWGPRWPGLREQKRPRDRESCSL